MTSVADPYRVVDSRNQGWHPAGDGGGGTVWSADYGHGRGLADIATLDQLSAARGPLRPVLPVTAADEAQLRALFTDAKRKAVTTLAAALELVFHQLRETAASTGNADEAYAWARRTMLAGREGSWESESLFHLILFGNDLNLDRKVQGSIDQQRAAQTSKRLDYGVRGQMAEIFRRWVTDPSRYTEVAETMAGVVSGYADETYGTDGWRRIADQWLQPRALDHANFTNCYSLLYSRSRHFDPSLI